MLRCTGAASAQEAGPGFLYMPGPMAAVGPAIGISIPCRPKPWAKPPCAVRGEAYTLRRQNFPRPSLRRAPKKPARLCAQKCLSGKAVPLQGENILLHRADALPNQLFEHLCHNVYTISVRVSMASHTRCAHTLVCTSLPCFATTMLLASFSSHAQKARRMPGHKILEKLAA